MNKRYLIKRLTITLKENRYLLFILFLWFLIGFLVYFFFFKLSIWDALKASAFFRKFDSDFSNAYEMWSQGVIFGIIFTFLFQNIIEKYNPERGCRMLAKEMTNHVIVIGFSHLGERLINYFRENKIPYCLVEKDKEKIDDLLDKGEPVIIDDAKELDVLEDARVKKAKAVIIATNNLETVLVVTKRVRQQNKNCLIIARSFKDEFAEIIEYLGADLVISSSKEAFESIKTKLNKTLSLKP